MFFDRSLYVSYILTYYIQLTYIDSQWEMYYQHCRSNRKHRTNKQILFLIGLTLIIGFQKTLAFFSRRQKLRGTAAFASGIILILCRWPLTGFLIELYGLFILFGDFLVTIGQFAGSIPVIGPYVRKALERAAGGRSNAELPV